MRHEDIENINVSNHTKDYSKEGSISILKLYETYILNVIPEHPLRPSKQNFIKFRENLAKNPPEQIFSNFNPRYPLITEEPSLLRNATRFRKICKKPFKVLDAPALSDDFYLNVLDWSDYNILAVGLGSFVYLWSAKSS